MSKLEIQATEERIADYIAMSKLEIKDLEGQIANYIEYKDEYFEWTNRPRPNCHHKEKHTETTIRTFKQNELEYNNRVKRLEYLYKERLETLSNKKLIIHNRLSRLQQIK